MQSSIFLLFLWSILIFRAQKCWFIELNLTLSSDVVCIFDDFSRWSTPKALWKLWNFIKYAPKKLAKNEEKPCSSHFLADFVYPFATIVVVIHYCAKMVISTLWIFPLCANIFYFSKKYILFISRKKVIFFREIESKKFVVGSR